MKNFSSIILAAGLIMALAFPASAATQPAAAPATQPSGYAFVNLNRVMHDCTAGEAIRKELDAKGQQFQAELTKENQALSSARQDFEKVRGTLPQAEAEKKWHELEGKYAQADKMLQERRHTLNRAGSSSFAELKKATINIILEMSKENNYAAVFSQESVILAADQYDITDKVISRLNDKVKKIAVDWSAKPQKPAPQ